jgi:hypothetical protein
MTVLFATKSLNQNRFTLTGLGKFGKAYFRRGAYQTEDKEEIRELLKHPAYKRGEYQLVTNAELVAKYLEGDEPDKITMDILDTVNIEGVKKLGEMLGAKNEQPALIKAELDGEPLTTQAKAVIDFYQTKLNKPVEPETFEIDASEEEIADDATPVSTDFSVRQAVKYMKETPKTELEGFLSEDEDRTSLINEYNKIIGE